MNANAAIMTGTLFADPKPPARKRNMARLAREYGVSRRTLYYWQDAGTLESELAKRKPSAKAEKTELGAVEWMQSELGFTPHKWQAEMLEIWNHPRGPEVTTVQKGTQIGVTTLAAASALHRIAQGAATAYFMSKASETGRLMRSMIRPFIERSPSLQKIVLKSPIAHQRFSNDGELHLRSSKTEADYASFTAEACYLDEFDKYFSDVAGAGDPIELARDRVAVRGGRVIAYSSPFGTGGTLSEHRRMSDLHLDYWLGCLDCKERFVPSWDLLIASEGVHPCPHCGSVLTHNSLPQALEAGRWQSANGAHTVAGELRGADDAARDWPRSISMHITSLHSPLVNDRGVSSWRYGIDRLQDADKSKSRPRKVAAHNSIRGEFWTDSVAQDLEALLKLRKPFEVDPAWLTSCGVDVQHDRLEAGLWAWDKHENMYLLRHDVLPGPTSDHRSGAWALLSSWLNVHSPGITLVDSGDGARTDTVYAFVREAGRMIWPCKGASGEWFPIFKWPSSPNEAKVRVVGVGKEATSGTILDILAGRDKSRRVTFHAGVDDEVISQFANLEKRVHTDRRGREKREFVQLGPQEAIDCARYALAAQRLGTRRMNLRLDPSERQVRKRRPTRTKSVRGLVNGF